MTDDTQPEAMDLADWLEAVGGGPSAKRCAALLREQHARIAELESELEAVGAGGVQALSAAPAEQQAAPKAAPGELHDHQILAITTAYEQGVGKGRQAHESGKEITNPYGTGYRCDLAWQYGYEEGKKQAERIAEAAPQQEAQEPMAYVHVPHYTVEGKVRPVVSFEKYQQDYDDGIYSTRIPLYTAPQPAPAAVAGPSDVEIDDFLDSPACITWIIASNRDRYRLLVRAVLAKWAAPQQEAQEPFGWVKSSEIESARRLGGSINLWRLRYDCDTPLYTAPQAAPAAQGDVEDAARYQWLSDYLIGDRTDIDDAILACASEKELSEVIDADRKKGGKP